MSIQEPGEISSKTSQGRSADRFLDFLRAAALLAAVAGAAGSLVLMLRAGERTPRFLLVLFTIWVLSPFAALLWANMVSKRWSVLTRATLYAVTLVITLGSLAIYGEWVDVKPAGAANAFLFVAVPPESLVFMTIVVSVAAFLSRRFSHRNIESGHDE